MQFDLASDLHTDRWPVDKQVDWAKHKQNDIIIIAGDVSDPTADVVAELKRIAAVYKTVLYVDGNHEHRPFDEIPYLGNAALHAEIAKIPNVVFLRDKVFIQDGVAIIGRNGWWDYKIGEPYVTAEQTREVYANNPNKPDPDVIATEAAADMHWLKSKVTQLQADDTIHSIIVVTHTAPHAGILSWNVYPKQLKYTGFYGNSSMAEVLRADKEHKIKFWLSGHNHDCKDIVIGGVRFYTNPRGRPNDFNREDYKPVALKLDPPLAPPVKPKAGPWGPTAHPAGDINGPPSTGASPQAPLLPPTL